MKKKQWSGVDKANFLLKCGELLGQGYRLEEVIHLLKYEQPHDETDVFSALLHDMEEGKLWSESLEPFDFPADVLTFLYIAENYGELSEGCIGAGKLYHKKEEIKQKGRRILRYPLIVVSVVIFLSSFMFYYVFPQFHALFESMNVEFPLVTRVVIRLMEVIPFIVLFFLGVAAIVVLYIYPRFRRMDPRKQMYLLCHIPFALPFIQNGITYYFSLQISCLIKGGLTIHESLSVFQKQHHLPFFKEEAEMLQKQLHRGQSFSKAVQAFPWYHPELAKIIKHGQTSGFLADHLFFLSNRMIKTLEDKVQFFIMICQPAMLVVIGGVVLFLFLSILIPMFELMGSIG